MPFGANKHTAGYFCDAKRTISEAKQAGKLLIHQKARKLLERWEKMRHAPAKNKKQKKAGSLAFPLWGEMGWGVGQKNTTYM